MRMLVNLFSQAKLETKALKAKRPGFTDERYNETSYYHEPENSKIDLISQIIYYTYITKYVECPLTNCSITFLDLRKVYPYYFTFTTFTKGRWVGERILDVFAREFRAHPATEYVSI